MYKAPVDVMRYLCPGKDEKKKRKPWDNVRGSGTQRVFENSPTPPHVQICPWAVCRNLAERKTFGSCVFIQTPEAAEAEG